MTGRVPTGCTGLDDVLHGGFPPNTITVIMGAPGTGKTILAEQIAFRNATPESLFIRHRPGYVVIDSFKALNELLGSDLSELVPAKL